MAQKFIKSQNKNSHSEAYGKYYATAVYDNNFIGTEELADFIQRQASVKKSDIKAKIVGHRDFPNVHKSCPVFDCQTEYAELNQ